MNLKETVKSWIRRSLFDEGGYIDTHYGASGIATRQPVYVRSQDAGMRVGTAFRCVDILSGDIGALNIIVERKVGGIFKPDENHPLNVILNVRPNSRMTAFDLIKHALIMMLNTGNAYLLPEWDIAQYVSNLTLLSPHSVASYTIFNLYVLSFPINHIYGSSSV